MKHLLFFSKAIALICISILLFNGCALIFKGTSEKVNFTSEPSGTKVYVNGQLMGNTPLELKLESKKTYVIEFKKEGYESKTIQLSNSVAAGYIVLDVLFGVVPVIIDAATGAWYTLDQDHINGVLEIQKK
ncbi:MAG TPA: PEGA domain-containing protein [Candidatus Kapabacteria bacterium]|nr:PEGA domain-containing protein [Candidatus Kapabacteria bacterium]